MDEKALTTIDFSNKEILSTIKGMVSPEVTEQEFKVFCLLCQSSGLNPIRREVWLIKSKPYTKKDGTKVEGKCQIMVGIHGLYAIANSHPQFDGIENEECTDDKGDVLWIKSKVWRKDRKLPFVNTAYWNEYFRPNTYGNEGTWEKMPHVMLTKCADAGALRKAFPQQVSGLYIPEEMGTAVIDEEVTTTAPKVSKVKEISIGPKMYDVSKADPETKEEVEKYLEQQGAFFDPEREVWVSEKEIKKCMRLETNNHEIELRNEAL